MTALTFLLGLLLLIILLELLHSLLGGLVILIQGDLKLHCVPVPVNGEGHLIARLTVLDGGFEGLAARHCGAVDSGDNIARLEAGLAGAGAVQDSQHLRAGGNAVLLGLLGHVLHQNAHVGFAGDVAVLNDGGNHILHVVDRDGKADVIDGRLRGRTRGGVFCVCDADDYIKMFEQISDENFDSELLKDIKNTISEDTGALNAVKKLERISSAFNIRYNPIIHQVLCGLLLWDFHLGFMMDKWRDRYGSQVKDWIHAISRMEELLSFAALARTRDVSYPEVTRHDKVEVTAENMRHPLIDPSKVVPNGAAFKGGTTIITGSNMSGKTTFLRTLGINLILAYAGAPVCAENMHADYMKIFTSMRVTDDVSNGISTFYAEILRIKSMVEYKKNDMPMLCLIDEIFKGTNSADRIVGASQVIKKLSDDNSMTIVSTHDFELCDLKNEAGVPAVNYHFEEYYEGDQLRFDYKKKDGRCTTTNAMAILHMAGLD